MKLKYIIFILTAFMVIMSLTGCSDEFSEVTDIEIVNMENGEKETVSAGDDSGSLILSAIKNAEKTDMQSAKAEFQVDLVAGSERTSCGLSFDVDNRKVYIIKDDSVREAKGKDAAKLFVDKNFSYIYIENNMNSITLQRNGVEQEMSLRYDWSFKDTEGFDGSREGVLTDEGNVIELEQADILSINYDLDPDSQIVRVYNKGNIVATGGSLTEVVNGLTSDGDYYVEVEAKWYKGKHPESYGIQTASFEIQIDNPADFEVITKENYPGNVMIVRISNMNENETVKITTTGITDDVINAYPYKDKYMALMSIGLYVPVGTEEIKAVFNEGKDNEYTVSKNVDIGAKSFKTQYLTVSEELNSSNNDDGSISEFVQVVKPARAVSEPKKLWDGVFDMPVEGRLTTDYAEIRYVNNEMSSSRHSGLDLAAPTGTEIKAPNNGKVTLAAEGLLSSGNTLVIDHGMGLFTSYYHMDTIGVKVGDTVEKGDIIGTVGSTGFSTGPHLHYAVSIYNSYINPYQTLTGIFD